MIAIIRPTPVFVVGQLVQHRRYRYRGVVVAVDRYCHAPDAWYRRNQTQPDRQQPWYHVLVDGRDAATYAAQTSLQADDSSDPVQNPLVPVYFQSFAEGRYLRNDHPWQGW